MAVYFSIYIATIILITREGFGRTIESIDSIATCTQMVTVPRASGRCMTGFYETIDVDALQTLITSKHVILEQKLNRITDLLIEHGPQEEEEEEEEVLTSTIGVVYTQWGKTTCPGTAETIYQGYVGKSRYDNGGGVNYLCLPREPEFPEGATAGIQSYSYIFGTEYYRENSPLMDQSHHRNDVPCAVCDVRGRSRALMIPAKLSCPAGWVKEYRGLLMSQHNSHKGSDYICVADGMENVAGGASHQSGAVLYVVEARCGPLKCPPYTQGYEIGCVVCTK